MNGRNVPVQNDAFVEPARITNENFPHKSNRLFHIQIGVTYACQCRCEHCGVSEQRNREDLLTVDEIVDLCRQAKEDMGAQVVELFGGEPLVRKEIREIVAGCSKYLDVWMSSNGMGFTKEMATDLAASGLKRVFFSLDSSDAKTHDRNRNREGCFDAVQKGVEYCNELGIDANFSTCAMARLVESKEVKELIDHTTRSGARKIRLVLPKMSGRLSKNESVLLNPVEIEQIRKLTAANEVAYVEAEGNFEENIEKCFCLRGHVYINPYGVVQPCVYTLLNYGNIRDYPLKFLYRRMFHHPVFKDKSILNLCLLQNPAFVQEHQSELSVNTPIGVVELDDDAPLARFPESRELMDEDQQVKIYAQSDLREPFDYFITLFKEELAVPLEGARVADLGCGVGEISFPFVEAFPGVKLQGFDGSLPMLSEARKKCDARTDAKPTFTMCHLPSEKLTSNQWDLIISNSFLHHLEDPMTLWQTIEKMLKPGSSFFIMDLVRPPSIREAKKLMEMHEQYLDKIMYRDFYSSLLAAYRLDEVKTQLGNTGLQNLVIKRVNEFQFVASGQKPQ